MSKASNKKITLMQYIFIISGAQVGIGILSMPRQLAETAGTDGWISIILGWLLAMVISLVIIKIMQRHPCYTIYDILKQYFGRWVGSGLSFVWLLYFAFIALNVMLTTIFVLQTWIIQNMATSTLTALILIPIFMVAHKGVQIIGRYAEFVFFFTLGLPVLLTIPVREGTLIYLLPLIKEGWLPILSTVKNTIISFTGFELAFILYPFLHRKDAAAKGILVANTLSMIIFLHITLLCYIVFSPDEITKILWPTLSLVKPIQFTFIERIEVLFLSFYIFFVSNTIIPNVFAGSVGISSILGLKNHKPPLIGLLIFIFILLIIIPNTYEVVTWMQNLWIVIGIGASYLFPLVLAIYISIYRMVFGRQSN
jgi:spore germination protein (amino acid permease)